MVFLLLFLTIFLNALLSDAAPFVAQKRGITN